MWYSLFVMYLTFLMRVRIKPNLRKTSESLTGESYIPVSFRLSVRCSNHLSDYNMELINQRYVDTADAVHLS